MNFELQLETGASLLKQAPQDVLQMDASLFGWGAALQGKSIRGAWSLLERKWHINKLAGTTSSKASPPDISKE